MEAYSKKQICLIEKADVIEKEYVAKCSVKVGSFHVKRPLSLASFRAQGSLLTRPIEI